MVDLLPFDAIFVGVVIRYDDLILFTSNLVSCKLTSFSIWNGNSCLFFHGNSCLFTRPFDPNHANPTGGKMHGSPFISCQSRSNAPDLNSKLMLQVTWIRWVSWSLEHASRVVPTTSSRPIKEQQQSSHFVFLCCGIFCYTFCVESDGTLN